MWILTLKKIVKLTYYVRSIFDVEKIVEPRYDVCSIFDVDHYAEENRQTDVLSSYDILCRLLH